MTTITTADPAAPAVPPGQVEIDGSRYMRNAKGGLDPVEIVAARDQLIDGEVRRIMGFATELAGRVSRFKLHTLDDFANLLNVLAQDYGTSLGGEKGNVTLTSYDGLLQVRLQVAERLTFGPELQAAKKQVDACLNEWSADTSPELRGIVQHAFNTDKEGLVNRAELFRLLRYEIADPRWQEAMRAIKDSVRVEGTKEYVRFYERRSARDDWSPVIINVAAA